MLTIVLYDCRNQHLHIMNGGGNVLFQDGFPNNMQDDVSRVVGLISLKTYNNVRIGTSEDTVQYYQNNTIIKFPHRMYFIDTSDVILYKLNYQQEMILHCIYSRSCDGFVRQKHLHSLLLMDYADWTIAYIVKLCDEYVIEILEMAYIIFQKQDTERIKMFCVENVDSFCKSYNRMISYWNEYYRDRCYKFKEYIGRKLFRECFGYTKSLERRK